MSTANIASIGWEEPERRLRLVETPSPAARPQTDAELRREAALKADRARHLLPHLDAEQALRLWEGLLAGRLVLVDWFDADGRRIIIARRTAAGDEHSARMSGREREVAHFAAQGESSKLIGYRLGISPSRVSTLLRTAMVKLGVRSKAQLVVMIRTLAALGHSPSLPAAAMDSNG
jgi:DNA-binding CsgD family transcriptional regulator